MRGVVCRPSELGPAEIERWAELQRQRLQLQNPFLSAEFAAVISRARPEARVTVVSEDNRIVGFFPFEAGAWGVGRPIGAGLSDSQAFVHEAGLDWDWKRLLALSRLQMCDFDHLIADQAQSAKAGWRVKSSPIIDLSGGYEEYLVGAAARSKHLLKNLRYQDRRLRRDFADVQFHCGPPAAGWVSRLITLKSAQYRRNGFSDIFRHADVMRICEELAVTSGPTLRSVLAALVVDGVLIAGDFSLCSDSVFAGWVAAHDMQYAKYSPGFVRTMMTLRALADAGVSYVDMGKGDEEYKAPLSNGTLPVAEGIAHRPSLVSAAWRAQATPRSYAYNFILDHPTLRHRVRNVRRRLGSWRVESAAKGAGVGAG